MVDKIKVKDYVAKVIGEDFVIPTLGVWDDPDLIDFDALPDSFVLKCNHNSGTGMFICRDKSRMEIDKVKAGLHKGLKENYYLLNREWPYKNVQRRVLAEKYISPKPGTYDLPDYKFFCFNGIPKFCQVISGRENKMCIDFFDREWRHQPFHEPRDYPFADSEPARPDNLDIMLNASSKLSQGLAFSRVDFYDIGERVFFGELTFFPTSGLGGFEPNEIDSIFGQMIELPIID